MTMGNKGQARQGVSTTVDTQQAGRRTSTATQAIRHFLDKSSVKVWAKVTAAILFTLAVILAGYGQWHSVQLGWSRQGAAGFLALLAIAAFVVGLTGSQLVDAVRWTALATLYGVLAWLVL